jgi:Tfp pilus assembly protein PilF
VLNHNGPRLTLFILVCVGFLCSPVLSQSRAELERQAHRAFQEDRLADAVRLYRQVYDSGVAERGHGSVAAATGAFNLSLALLKSKRWEEALPFVEEACTTAEKLFGANDRRLGECLLSWAEAKAHTKTKGAEDTADRALALIANSYPPDESAAAVYHAGEIFRDAGDFDAAEKYFGRSAARYEPADLNEPGFLAASLSEQAEALYSLHRYIESLAAARRAVALMRASRPMNDPNLVSSVYLLAKAASVAGDFDEALTLLNEVAQKLESVTSPKHIMTEDILLQIAQLQRSNGGSSEAIATAARALDRLKRAATDASRQRVGSVWEFLAETYREQRDTVRTDDAFRQAIAAEDSLQGSSTVLPDFLSEYGFFLLREGRYANARVQYDRALELMEKAQGADSAEAASILEKLGTNLFMLNDKTSAKPLLLRARTIVEHTNPGSMDLAQILRLLASCIRSGQPGEALRLEQRANGMQEKVEGVTSALLVEKASVSRESRDLPNARKQLEAALALDPGNPVARDALASVTQDQGNAAQAIALIRESIALTERSYAADSINVGARYYNLGGALLLSGDTAGAREAFLNSAERFNRHSEQLFGNLSLAEQRLLIPQEITSQTGGLLSTSQSGDALLRAYDFVVGWKGLLVEAIARQEAFEALANDSGHKAIVARWKTLRTQEASWALHRDAIPDAEWRATNDRITAEKEKLERTLEEALPAAAGNTRTRTEAVRAALRQQEVFVDIYRYDDLSRRNRGSERYAAIVTSPTAGPTLIPLGDAKLVESALTAWIGALGVSGNTAWRALTARIWQPIRNAMPAGTTRVRVSPDGALVRMPWHSFSAQAGDPPLEVIEVDSARSLLRSRRTPPAGRTDSLFLVGDLDYDSGRTPKSPGKAGSPFAPLVWAGREAGEIEHLARQAGLNPTFLRGGAATKQVVIDGMAKASFVHFSTHGFMAGEADLGYSGRNWTITAATYNDSTRNPLVQSGIAISGANVRIPGTFEAPGVLTAEELTGIDLQGTRLVVLSACDTALGIGMTGQGFLGLRSSFSAAGTRTYIVSLWPVDDEATKILMSAFYRKIWMEKKPVVTAFHEAQQEVRSNPRFAAPRFWAGWSIVGDPD